MDNKFNEVLKAQEAERERLKAESADGPVALDSVERLKVLSPGQLVFKRFIRNRLAIVGTVILVFMFLFSFVGPLFYSHGQTEIFYKYAEQPTRYAMATTRSDYSNYIIDDTVKVENSLANMMNSYIKSMESAEELSRIVTDKSGNTFLIAKLADQIYAVTTGTLEDVGTYSTSQVVANIAAVNGVEYLVDEEIGEEFEAAAVAAFAAGESSFEVDGDNYTITKVNKLLSQIAKVGGDGSEGFVTYNGRRIGTEFEKELAENLEKGSFFYNGNEYSLEAQDDGSYHINAINDAKTVFVSSIYSMDFNGADLGNAFKGLALIAYADEEDNTFEFDGKTYAVESGEDGITVLEGETEVAGISNFVVRSYSGQDSLSSEFKEAVQAAIADMQESGDKKRTITAPVPEIDENGQYVRDEAGNLVEVDTDATLEFSNGSYVITVDLITHLIDIYGSPSAAHPFGTDADGMDILARMMYGGRISLMVGFVVVIIETILGVIMGGVAGYFGGWVDNLIMRLVDIFYCIPTYPILIIMGSYFDAAKLDSYTRLFWMMMVLGFLGWAGVARLVRGQILSLREQEFMTAAEATGISTNRRIFRHLIPNVMPQLIVNMTMGLGGVIITESTLSFLGLGVKHPLATWGTMINSITSSNENLARFAYIWIPVGLLICLTVIAFNFVGDGLRDAFDPKMKR